MRCLQCLKAGEDGESYEVIVVDDGGDFSLAAVEQAGGGFKHFKLLRIEHAGRSAARNAGVAEARGERLWFLGDDVMVEPGTMARHRAQNDPMIAVVGPYPWKDLDGSPPFKRWAEPNPQWKIKNPENAGFLYFATGNISMERAVFERLGGFDTQFERYGWEDLDLGLRFERAGGRLIFDDRARAEHVHPGMGRRQLWRREEEMGYTALQFYEKWKTLAPEAFTEIRFWPEPEALVIPPRWRTWLGECFVALLDGIAPASKLNRACYERMIFSHRFRGIAAAWRDMEQSKGAGDD